MSKEPLTKRQAAVLAYIRKHIADKHYPPSLRDIGAAMDITSPNGVIGHIRSLVSKGYLKRPTNSEGRAYSRALVVVD